MQIRRVTSADAMSCVKLAEARRVEYQNYEATFWKKAENSAISTLRWFETLFSDDQNVAYVAIDDAVVVGFIIAREFPTPPVYDPGGATALIDDFCVASKNRWKDIGAALLQETKLELCRRGFAQIVVVGAAKDLAKTEFLNETGLSLASTWWTTAL
ncbi:MAG: GNAT family N-acetyltransferase [Alphaproteobacteria bacterium]|nr:GNAT family N-acetyltransferase [Alphaproteobacteria bacterium]